MPEELRTSRLVLRPLRQVDVAEDYEAVMSSADMLRRWSQSSWPTDEFTLEDNRKDLERHEREHAAREAFTFTILDPDRTRCLGCVYLAPAGPELGEVRGGARFPVTVGFWVRASEIAGDLDRHLLDSLL